MQVEKAGSGSPLATISATPAKPFGNKPLTSRRNGLCTSRTTRAPRRHERDVPAVLDRIAKTLLGVAQDGLAGNLVRSEP
jgi:hypothetical protein